MTVVRSPPQLFFAGLCVSGFMGGSCWGLGLGLPLLVGACGEESCTVAVAERLDVCGAASYHFRRDE